MVKYLAKTACPEKKGRRGRMDTVVVIPAYKPDMRLAELAKKLCGKYYILIVDDGSGTKFDKVFTESSKYATVLRYPVNRGKGGALKYAFSNISKLFPGAEFVVTADADGQHTPEDIEKVSNGLREKGGLVLGSRRFTGKVPARSKFGNSVTRAVFTLASGARVYDTQTGLRGFSTEYLPPFSALEGDRYEYEMTMLMYAAEKKIPITEVTIETIYENGNETSHFNAVKDSFRIYHIIYKCSHILKFMTSSLAAFLVNYVLVLILYHIVLTPDVVGELSMEISTLVAWPFSSYFNFILNRKWVFRSEVPFGKSLAEYYGLAVISFVMKSYVFLEILKRLLGIPLAIAMPISELAMYIVNYFVQKKFVFASEKKKRTSDK